MRSKEFISEAALGTKAKRPARSGSRPDRGHEPQPRYKAYCDACDRPKSQCICNTVDESKTQKQEAPKPRNFVAKNAVQSGAGAHKDKKKAAKQGDTKHKAKAIPMDEAMGSLEHEFKEAKAPVALCKSSTPDEDLGASQLASCKSQGLRARDGNKSHKLGKSPKSRIKVGGHRIKGQKYGGPLPDWS